MTSDRFLSTLGLARRAGKLCYGMDSTVDNISLLKALFLACDVSERTKRNIGSISEENGVQVTCVGYTKSELGFAIGTKPVGIIGVTDKGFSGLLTKGLSREVIE